MSQTKTKLNSTQNQKGAVKYSLLSVAKMLILFLRLTSEQTSLLFKRKIEGKRTISEWLRLFEQLAEFDKHADNSRKVFIMHVWIGVVLSFFAMVIIIGVENTALLDILWRVVLLFLLLHLLPYWILKKFDLSNRLRTFFVPLLKILARESEEQSLLTLTMELASSENKKFLTSNTRTPPKKVFSWSKIWLGLIIVNIIAFFWVMSIEPGEGFYFVFAFIFLFIAFAVSVALKTYPIVITKIYTYPWLIFSLKMADDTTLAVEMTDTLIVRKVHKKNFRGKVKTKVKKIIRRRDKITISFEKDEYEVAKAQNISNEKSKKKDVLLNKSNEKRHVFRIENREKILVKNDTDTEPSLQAFLAKIAKAYQTMKPIEN
ncbi:hypothetical protein [Raineya sp.]|jgi:hypothetical protein